MAEDGIDDVTGAVWLSAALSEKGGDGHGK